jgi:hydroxymethylpyrimidine pyrophosphatase-like HAD family hydrolase
MVTGRRVPSLLDTFQHATLFHVIVAENGAVIYDPHKGDVRVLAQAPPPALVDGLKAAGVPAVIGHSIIETVEPHQQVILELIRAAGLEWHIIFNKGSVMGLPAGITKCTGLAHVLRELGIGPEVAVGMGDAENDHAFLSYCGLAVAVANALPSLRAEAHIVTAGRCGDGVIEIAEAWLDGRLDNREPATASSGVSI